MLSYYIFHICILNMGVNALKNKLLIIEMISDDSEENVS